MKLSYSFRVLSFVGQLVGCTIAATTTVSTTTSSSQAVAIESDKSIEPVKKAPDTSIEKPDIFSSSSQAIGCESNPYVATWCGSGSSRTTKGSSGVIGTMIDTMDDANDRTLDAIAVEVTFNDTTDTDTRSGIRSKQKIQSQGQMQQQQQQQQHQQCGMLPDFDEYGCTCYGDPSKCPSDCIGGQVPIEKTHYSIKCNGIPDVTNTPNYILKEWHQLNRCEENSIVSAWCNDYVNRHLACNINTNNDQYVCKCSGKHSNCPDECIDGSTPIERNTNSIVCTGIPNDNPNYILTTSTITTNTAASAA
jgi:hypothetical protein